MMGWKCKGCKKMLVVRKGILDRGGTVECSCGCKTHIEKKKNGKLRIT